MRISKADRAQIEKRLNDATFQSLFAELLMLGGRVASQCPVTARVPGPQALKQGHQTMIALMNNPGALPRESWMEINDWIQRASLVSQTLSGHFPMRRRWYWQNVLFALAFNGDATVEQFRSGGRPRGRSPETIKEYQEIAEAYNKAGPDLTQSEYCRMKGISRRKLARAINFVNMRQKTG